MVECLEAAHKVNYSGVIGEQAEVAMYHYDPQTALEELKDDVLLPNPVYVRDMILRARLEPDLALELNREFQNYIAHFGETQEMARHILEKLAASPRKSN